LPRGGVYVGADRLGQHYKSEEGDFYCRLLAVTLFCRIHKQILFGISKNL